jgi:hypothetical protein
MKMNKKFARKDEKVERKRTGFGHEMKKKKGDSKGTKDQNIELKGKYSTRKTVFKAKKGT